MLLALATHCIWNIENNVNYSFGFSLVSSRDEDFYLLRLRAKYTLLSWQYSNRSVLLTSFRGIKKNLYICANYIRYLWEHVRQSEHAHSNTLTSRLLPLLLRTNFRLNRRVKSHVSSFTHFKLGLRISNSVVTKIPSHTVQKHNISFG